MPAKVVVVGSLVTDYITTTPRFPRPGETVFGHGLSVGFGGKGANQCLAADRLGAETAFVGKFGQDAVGDNFLAALQDTTINIDHVSRTTEAQSAVANVTVDDAGENCIVNIPGANQRLTVEDVEAAADVIGGASVLVCQNEVTISATRTALQLARKVGVTTLHNAGPGIPDLDPEIIRNSDIFCVNETEAEVMTGVPVSSVADAVSAGKAILAKGCKGALITLGAQGVVWLDSDTLKTDKGYVSVAAEKVKAVDTTGAGDAFIGSLAFFLAYHPSLPMREKLSRACAIATRSVMAPGAWNSFPARKDLPDALFQG